VRRRLSDPVTMQPWPSFVDALAATLLVLVFIITILSIFSGKVLEQVEGREKAKQASSRLNEDLALLLKADGVRIESQGEELRIRLPEDVLFGSGEAALSPDGTRVVEQLGERLAAVTTGHIYVEGHTDDRDISGALAERFPSNWELSTARATRVVRLLAADSGIDPERLTASGYAEHRPVASNETEEGRAANRRIEIRVTP
jgi:chemotaxis protein MotB